MPALPPKTCNHPGCRQLVYDGSGLCALHKRPARYKLDYRKPAYQRGYDAEWRKVRRLKLRMNPLCERCGKIATVVHHKQEVADRPDLRLDIGNLESLCFGCHEIHHNRKKGSMLERIKIKKNDA